MSELNSPFSVSLGQIGGPVAPESSGPTYLEASQARVARAAEARQLMLNAGSQERLATAFLEGNDLGQSPLAQDLLRSGIADIERRYGSDVAAQMQGVHGHIQNIEHQRNVSRGTGEFLQDTGLGVTAGALQGIGGTAAFVTGLFSDQGGAYLADKTNQGTEFIREGQSDILDRQRELGQIRSGLDREDIARLYEEEKSAGDSLAEMRRFGREFLAAGEDLIQNPSLAGDLVAEGTGSLVGSLGISGLARKGLVRVLGKATAGMSDEAAMAVSIGLLEGGGAYAQIQAEIQGMSEEELSAGSPEYVQLRQSGMSHEEARDRIANIAGLEGGAIQAAIGTATGSLVARFEANPLRVGGGTFTERLATIGQNVLKEGIEEGLQEGSSSYVTADAVRRYADPTIDPLEGVGTAAAQGLAAGVGMAGVLQTPGVALDTARTTGRVAAEAAQAQAQRVQDRIEAESPVATATVAEAAQNLTDNLNQLQEVTVAEATDPESTTNTAAQDVTAQAEYAIVMTDEELAQIPAAVHEIVGELPDDAELSNRAQIVISLVPQLARTKSTGKAEATLWVAAQMNRIKALESVDLTPLPDAHRQVVETILQSIDALSSNAHIAKALTRAERVTAADLGSPTPQNQLLLSQVKPADVDADYVDGILAQRAAEFTENQQKGLRVAAKLAREALRAEAEKEALAKEAKSGNTRLKNKRKIKPTRDIVKKQIENDGMDNEQGLIGLSAHQALIVAAMDAGNIKAAELAMTNLQGFAQHMINKLAAARESYALGRSRDNEVRFDAWNGSAFMPNQGKIYISPFSPNSVRTGKEVALDAQSAVNTFNNLLEEYGDQLNFELMSVDGESNIELQDANAPVKEETKKERVKAERPEVSQREKAQIEADLDADMAPKKKERRLRKDAVLKKEESLIDDGDDISDDTKAEIADIITLLDLLGVRVKEGLTNVPAEAELLNTYNRLLTIFDDVAVDESNFKKYEKEVGRLFSWVRGDLRTENGDRKARAIKAAKKRGANESSSYVAQLAEETIEVLEEVGSTLGSKKLEVIKRRLKVMRFGANTVIKQDGPYKGLTNQEALERAESELRGSAKEEAPAKETIVAEESAREEGTSEYKEAGTEGEPEQVEDSTDGDLTEEEIAREKAAADGISYLAEIEAAENEADRIADEEAAAAKAAKEEAEARRFPSFPNLLKTKSGVVRFMRAMTIDTEKSEVMLMERPLQEVVKFLESLRNDANTSDSAKAQIQSLEHILNSEGEKLRSKMNARLNQKIQRVVEGDNPNYDPAKGKGKNNSKYLYKSVTPLESLALLDDATDRANGKVLAILDEETKQFDPQLLEAAVLATIDWMINKDADRVPMSRQDIAEQEGIPVWKVTRAKMRAYNSSYRPDTARDSLAQNIMAFWGATPNNDVTISDTQGIPSGVAAEMLDILLEEGLVQEHKVKLSAEEDAFDALTVTLGDAEGHWKTVVDKLGPRRNLIKDQFIPEYETKVYLNEVPQGRVKTQKGNPIGEVSRKQQDAIDGERAVRHMPTLFAPMLAALGEETYIRMMGYNEADKSTTHIQEYESIEGKNKGLKRSFKLTTDHWQKVQEFAEANDLDPNEVETHYDYYLGSNNRMMARGFTGQADKTMRHAFAPTAATLDLNDETDMAMLWRGIGQMADVAKPELLSDDEVVEKTFKKLYAIYPGSIEVFDTYLSTGEFTSEMRETLVEEFTGKDAEQAPEVAHAVFTAARLFRAQVEGQTSFDTHLPLEADGKTDGPFHALMHYLSGRFNQVQLKAMRKGGLFLGETHTTLADYFKGEGKREGDLYEFASQQLVPLFARVKQAVQGIEDKFNPGKIDQKPVEQMDSLENTLNMFGGIDFDEKGDLVIGRNVLKNPLTVTIYGSGATGIASKIAQGVMDAFNQAISETLRLRAEFEHNNPGKSSDHLTIKEVLFLDADQQEMFETHLDRMFSRQLVHNSFEDTYYATRTIQMDKGDASSKVKAPLEFSLNMSSEDLRKFEFSPENRAMLVANIETGFVAPMRAAINIVTDGAPDKASILMTASQVQATVLHYAFFEAVGKLLAAKQEAGELTDNEGLSNSDYKAIFKEVGAYSAVVGNVDGTTDDFTHVNLSAKERSDEKRKVATSMNGKWNGPVALPGPAEAGVKAMPLVTISEGDARMMANYFAEVHRRGEVSSTQQVYDGLEMPLDLAQEIQLQINKADAEAIMENVMGTASDAFSDFLRQDTMNFIAGNPDLVEELLISFLGEKGYDEIKEEPYETQVTLLKSQLTGVKKTLKKRALGSYARKEAMKDVGFALEHMAAARRAYVEIGRETKEVTSDEELLQYLNERYEYHLSEAKKADKESDNQPTVADPDKDLVKALEAFGQDNLGITSMSLKNFNKVLGSLGLSEDQKAILKAMELNLADFKVMVGEPGALNLARKTMFPGQDHMDSIEHGLTDLNNKIIYIGNASIETSLHEMLHAASGAVSMDYYSDPALVSDAARTAIQNLEKLMTQFQGLSFDFEDAGSLSAAKALQEQIIQAKQSNSPEGKFIALQEFIAWTLTNGHLVRTLKKTKNRSKLARLVGAVSKLVKNLLRIPQGTPLDMFTNIQWNTGVLLRSSPLAPNADMTRGASFSGLLHQRTGDKHLRALTQKFENKLASYVLDRGQSLAREDMEIDHYADDILNTMTANGLTLDETKRSAFRTIHAVMAYNMEFDRGALIRAQKLFRHVLKDLKVEDLMETQTDDWAPNDRAQAQELFNIITGKVGMTEDPKGRTNMLATFMALSQVSPSVRRMLETKDVPAKPGIVNDSVDEALTSYGQRAMDALATHVAGGIGARGSVGRAIDRLLDRLARIEKDNRTEAEKAAQRLLSVGDHSGSQMLKGLSSRLQGFADQPVTADLATMRGATERILRGSVSVVATLMDENKGKSFGSALTSLMNHEQMDWVPSTLPKLINEVLGITDENRGVYSLMNKVKTSVSAMRQEHREKLPELLNEKFEGDITEAQWKAMHLTLGKTDIAALTEVQDPTNIRQMLQDPLSLKTTREQTEAELRSVSGVYFRDYQKKAKELSEKMVLGTAAKDNKQLRNAYAISLLMGEPRGRKIPTTTAEASEPVIDRYVSLLALELVKDEKPEAWTALQEVAAADEKGVEFVVGYLAQLRAGEKAKATTLTARINGWKGYIPAEAREGADLKVADDSEYSQLVSLGYTRIGDYTGSGLERGRKGYYFSTVGGNATYNQGVMQTVQKTANGVDIQNGRTVDGTTAGMLIRGSVVRIQNAVQAGHQSRGEALMPVFNSRGEVTAYERSMDPAMLEKLQAETQLDKMIGAWRGRQAEEQLAEQYNRILVQRVKDNWDEGQRNSRQGEYIDLSDPTLDNPVYRDAWTMIPPETKDFIREVFGEDGFMVRKDMIDNTVGYRSLTVGEAWTGPSDMPEPVKKVIHDVSTALMGKNAYRNVVVAEKAWQAGVSVAKQTIVIRSVIVPVANVASNVLQLLMNGVAMRDIVKGFKVKLVEIDKHLKNEERRVEIEAEQSQFRNGSVPWNKLEAEKRSLEDASKRMSIWPLIESGEFSTISEGLTDADAALAQGRWADYMQGLMDKVPAKLGTAGRYAMITRDTALFQGMSRAVQYGDFLAKAVLYDHMTQREGKSQEETMNRVTEEFVNYNLLPGKVRSYSESMGLAWFWAYKLRSIKVAHRHIRDHPLRALLTSVGMPVLPEPLGVSVGAPITDNAVSVIADGRAGYSLGLGMLFRALSLNPWVNIVN